MTMHDRLAVALNRLATATSVQRSREHDYARAVRNGEVDERFALAVVKFEAAADAAWDALGIEPDSPRLREAA